MDEMHQILMSALVKLLEATGVEELVVSDADMDEMNERGMALRLDLVEGDPSSMVLSLGEGDFEGDVKLTAEDGTEMVLDV